MLITEMAAIMTNKHNKHNKHIFYNLKNIDPQDAKKIQNETKKIYNKWIKGKNEIFIYVTMTNKFGTYVNGITKIYDKVNIAEIELSMKLYKNMGMFPIIGTLRHEMAHVIDLITNGSFGHNETFKEICHQLKGHMNPEIAGSKYIECAKGKIWMNESHMRYRLVCPECGEKIYRDRLDKRLVKYSQCQICETPLLKWKIYTRPQQNKKWKFIG